MQQTIIFMDSETTGVNHRSDQMLSLTMAAVDPLSGEVVEKKTFKIGFRGDVRVNPGAVAVNGINPLRHVGKTEAATALEVRDFIMRHGGPSAPVGGYKVSFDTKFIRSLLTRSGHDSTIVSHSQVELYNEAARMIHKKRFPVADLKQITTRVNGVERTRGSLTQGSVAQALKIEVDEKRLHDDSYDVDTSIRIWRSLGRPSAKRAQGANNPYEIQKAYGGKAVKTREWDPILGQVVEKQYYITGYGAGAQDDQFGPRTFHSAAAIRIDGEDYSDAVSRLEKEREARSEGKSLKKGGLGETAVKNIARPFVFDRPLVLEVEEVALNTRQRRDMEELSGYVNSQLENDRLKKSLQLFERDERGVTEDFVLDQPEDRTSILDHADEALVPKKAQQMASMNRQQRVDLVSKLANESGRGRVWAQNFLIMSERYGYRNGLVGFEEARVRDLREALPSHVEHRELEKNISELATAEKTLEKRGFQKVILTCEGKGVGIQFFGKSGDSEGIFIENEIDARGKICAPKAAAVKAEIQRFLSCNQAEANEIRSNFSGFIDNRSYESLKDSFQEKISQLDQAGEHDQADVLRQTLVDLGSDYDEYVRNTSPKLDLSEPSLDDVEAPVPEREDLSSLPSYVSYGDRLREELKDTLPRAYNDLPGVDADRLKAASPTEILKINLLNPGIARAKELDALATEHGVDLSQIDGQEARAIEPTDDLNYVEADGMRMKEAATEAEGELGQLVHFKVDSKSSGSRQNDSAAEDGIVRCKICNRAVRDANAVAGMGPKCAGKLLDFIDRSDVGADDITPRTYEDVSQVSRYGRFPIMIVRNKKTQKTFAADFVRKEEDGRYLVVDLSEVARRTASGKFDPLKDAARVYLDSDTYEVARVLGRMKKNQ